MTSFKPLDTALLYHRCDPQEFGFETTAELPQLTETIGQQRASDAVEFGISIERQGYNLFVMGPAGAGRHALVQQFLERKAASGRAALDWAYVNNFAQPHKPLALALPAGRGQQLKNDMQQLIEELRLAIASAFESDEYRSRIGQIDAEFNEHQEKALGELGQEAAGGNIGLLRTPSGFSFAPLKAGEVIGPEDYAKLPQAEREQLEQTMSQLQAKLEKVFLQVRQWRRERRDKIRDLNRGVTLSAVGQLMEEIKARYADLPRVADYLKAVQQDVIENADDFHKGQESVPGPFGMPAAEPSFRRYAVNVIVGRGRPNDSSVVFEDHPTYQNLVGRVEHIAQFGTLVTDFGLIKPGALHRANGGYLMLDVYKLLTQPFAWEGLKRALSTREIRIESLGQMYSLVSTESLEPEPIPLDLKVVLFGERLHYYLLYAWDPDFRKLFKVAADFEDHFPRTAQTHGLYARLVATIVRRDGLHAFERAAVARVIEHGARRVGDAKKLSANLRDLVDLLGEADFWARRAGRQQVGADDVQRAIDAQLHRADRLRAQVNEAILRGTLMIDTDGGKVGQVNGLSVFELGNYAFAEPTRITATARLGEGQVIDVQREVELGGSIHSKGVMILSSFLAARFSTHRPHSLSASLVFEQTYGTVEGDSASTGELCALMSSLAELPIRQSLAVTGSINQLGQVQAIGAVNEKIEGFFDICSARGLTGSQGVIIPASNVDNLMLRGDVVQAVRDAKFSIYAIESIDQAIELLTGVAAGERDVAGNWPETSVNGRVARRLRELAELRLKFAAGGKRRQPLAPKRGHERKA
ncbi:MAG: AAA family ATPase [Betaproteobacteria bacterium]|nr:AAA family ATPase [Betaproteobacteria bacterium]